MFNYRNWSYKLSLLFMRKYGEFYCCIAPNDLKFLWGVV
jgi:hypothetical protein